MPRSPRATMMPSLTSRISSNLGGCGGVGVRAEEEPGDARERQAGEEEGLGEWPEPVQDSPLHAFVVLNLANDLDVPSFRPQNLPDGSHIAGFAHEGGKDDVYLVLHPEAQVPGVLL